MSDQRIQIWNILHDGEITAVSGEGTDTLVMFVSVPFLRRRLQPLGDSFVLTLSGISGVRFQNFDGTETTLAEELDFGTPEILQTASESMPIKIETTSGRLLLGYQDITFSLDTGQRIDYETIEKTCEEYWTEWEARIRRDS